MNHDVPFPRGRSAPLSFVKTRALDLLIDEIPDCSYRLAVETHDALVRTSDAVLTHVRRLVARLRAAALP
jgi:hypothetical protein